MLHTQDHGEVRELRLDRPPANALTDELLAELRDGLVTAAESGARAIVLSGREGMFSAGLDVPHFLTLDRAGTRRAWRTFFEAMSALVNSPIPVACALTGHAPAGGCVLALCCDWRVMAEGNYRIGLNEVAVGVRMPLPIFVAASHVVGTRQAERMVTTSKLFDASEALAVGLVDELAPLEAVVERALDWSHDVAKLPPNTLRKSRALCRRDMRRALGEVDEDQLELFLDEWYDDECQDALRALVDRLAAKA